VQPETSNGRWQRIEHLFYEALDLEPSARATFLNQACGLDVTLREELTSLLKSSEQTLDFAREAVLQLAHDQSDVAIPAGKRIGAYQVIGVVGQGGMGTVCLASRADDLYRQNVAIKLMHAGCAQTESMRLRFGAERQILANLNHPNIAGLLDGGITDDGLPYLVMEFVDGVPIDAYGGSTQLSIEGLLALFLQVCEAVDYAHRNLVIHRDIKPGNILVTAEGTPKLVDFGISKLLESDTADPELTLPSQWMMTPEYASPEQLTGGAITTATDVYALGALLYKLLCDQSPFKTASQNPLDMMRAIRDEIPAPPSKVRGSHPQSPAYAGYRKYSVDLDSIVLKAMSKEPAQRYASVADLAQDLRRCLGGYPIYARGDEWTYRAGKFIRRHKTWVAGATLSAAALITFSLAMGILAKRANAERVVAEQQRLAAQKEANFLASIFDAATPDAEKGQKITARELLDSGAKRIDAELSAVPEAQATMLDDLGHAYTELGLYDRALPLTQRAYDLRLRILGGENLDTADTTLNLARIYRLEGKYQEAEPLFRRALAVHEKIAATNKGLIAESLNDLGECLYWEGHDAEAEQMLRRALTLDSASMDNDRAAFTRNYLALEIERKGAFDEAAQLLREAVDISRKTNGEMNQGYAILLQNLGGALIDMGDLSGAEATERQVLAIRRKLSGKDDHPDTAFTLNLLGYILLIKGDWSQAKPFLAEALAIRKKYLGQQHPDYGLSVAHWGRVLQAEGNYAGARENYEEALQILRQNGSSDSWTTAGVLRYLGLLNLDQGHYSAAESYARQALGIFRKHGGAENPGVVASLITIGTSRELQGDPASAEPIFQQVMNIRKKELPPDNPDVISAEIRLGEVLTAENRLDLAESLLSTAEKSVHHPRFPLLAWQIAEADSAMGILLAKQGKASQAYPLLRNAAAGIKTYPQAAMRNKILSDTMRFEQQTLERIARNRA
jgi:serine/threonine-protein kinase